MGEGSYATGEKHMQFTSIWMHRAILILCTHSGSQWLFRPLYGHWNALQSHLLHKDIFQLTSKLNDFGIYSLDGAAWKQIGGIRLPREWETLVCTCSFRFSDIQ